MGRSFVLLFALFAARPALAQDVEGELPAAFTSDRPGFAPSAHVAARERITTELGASVLIDDPIELRLPRLTLRAGLFGWLELRATTPDAIGRFAGDASFGVGDARAGFKIGGLVHESVSISTVWEASFPTATDGFGREEVELYAQASLEWRIWGPLSLLPHVFGSVLAITDDMGQTARVFEGGGSLRFTWRIIDVLFVFVEGFVIASEVDDLRGGVGGGVAWLVLPNVQLDASFRTGVTDALDPPPIVNAGVTVLW
jgi:hypothetical protein